MTVAGAGLVGLVTGAVLWLALRPTLSRPVYRRRNYRGHELPTAAGLVVTLAVLVLEATVSVVAAAGAELDPATAGARRLVVLAAVGFAFLGLLDDLAGDDEPGGFRGHLGALVSGRLTAGAVKLFGGAALAVAAVAASPGSRSLARLVADAALVALAANLANLFDRAPGRVTKVALLAFLALALATRADPQLAAVAAVVGAAGALLVPDLRERLMLGDTGANVVGAALGLGVVLACSPGTRLAVLVVLVVMNLASEAVSFSRVIERVPPLRAADRAGRRP